MVDTNYILNDIGLNKKESIVYETLLRFKSLKVSELSRHVRVSRTSIYASLESLKEKKLIGRVKIDNHYEWEAYNPKLLVDNTKKNLQNLQLILPELSALFENRSNPPRLQDVQYYKTKEGVKKVYEGILNLRKGERVYFIEGSSSTEAKLKKFKSDYIINWQKRFKAKGIILEGLISNRSIHLLTKKLADKKAVEAHKNRMVITYILPEELMDFEIDILQYRHVVAIIAPKQDTSLIIENSGISQAFHKLFLIAKYLGKKIDLNSLLNTEND